MVKNILCNIVLKLAKLPLKTLKLIKILSSSFKIRKMLFPAYKISKITLWISKLVKSCVGFYPSGHGPHHWLGRIVPPSYRERWG